MEIGILSILLKMLKQVQHDNSARLYIHIFKIFFLKFVKFLAKR